MKGKGLLKLVLLAAGIVTLASLLGAGSAAVTGVEAANGMPMKEQILRSTVQIEMVGEAWVEGGAQHRLGAQGLGTLVQVGGQRFILTHDHWSLANHRLSHVVLRDARGAQLQVLDNASFLSLVRYRDGGAMIWQAPRQLAGVAPAALFDGAAPAAGDTVWLPAHAASGTGLALGEARVQGVDVSAVPGTLQLRGATDAVAAGDSGAGVWYEGELIANLWAVTEARDVVIDTAWPWSRWFGGDDRWQRTGVMFAGLQPLRGATGLTADDLALGVQEETGYERGPQQQ